MSRLLFIFLSGILSCQVPTEPEPQIECEVQEGTDACCYVVNEALGIYACELPADSTALVL